MEKYRPEKIEPKWQKRWEEAGIYKTPDKSEKPKYYCLVMFAYSSGDLHIGHWYNFAPADVFARYKRMCGFNVLHPTGFDSFGLPAESAAIKKGVHPHEWTEKNVSNMTKQLKTIGAIYDWDRVVYTHRPNYYKWTQWLFLQLYKKGLVYKEKAPANWCPNCKSILANEQAEGGKCWRCEGPIEQRDVEQWFFKITDYADELLEDLEELDWPEKTITMQRNWIGRSEGILIKFPLSMPASSADSIEVFTTRPDTIFGTTFFVLAPEHPLVEKLTTPKRKKEVDEYVEKTLGKTELDRIAEIEEKTGVFTGAYVKNPLSGEEIPVYISDFVLMTYGTGAVMGVPGHDQRDWDFAKKYNLPIREVISGGDVSREAYTGEGELVNSGKYSGVASKEAISKITDDFEVSGLGKSDVQYHLRDWLVSRQRYWGAPVPIIYCDRCGIVPVPEEDLPVLLLEVKDFTPKEGESPLARSSEFVNIECPQCHGQARRDTDTMDTFVCSSWYYLRYSSPKFDLAPFDKRLVNYWMPVDRYIGGAEHTVLHLLYSRFVTKVLRDLGFLKFDEPFLSLRHQGIILGEDHEKMSKSRGNVVNPDDYISTLGADTFRMDLCFMGPYDQGGPWDPKGIQGVHRFLNRVWKMVSEAARQLDSSTASQQKEKSDPELERKLHQLIKKVGEDIEAMKFNTAVAAMMEFLNEVQKTRMSADKNADERGLSKEDWGKFLRVLAPFAPHITEELFFRLGPKPYTLDPNFSIHQQSWPEYDSELAKEAEVEIAVQVNGKLRGVVLLPVEEAADKEKVLRAAREDEKIATWLSGKLIKKEVFVPGKILNFVID